MGNERPIVLGIDPGFAATGYCLLQRIGRHVESLDVGVIETAKTPKKLMRDLRVSADDYRRVKEIYFALRKVIVEYQPVAVAYEVYQPFTGMKMRASSWKVARVEGLLVSVALMHEALVLPYLPLDLKKGITGKKSASKGEIERALIDLVPDIKAKLEAVPKTKREHVADAAGYAFLAFEEMGNLAKLTGV